MLNKCHFSSLSHLLFSFKMSLARELNHIYPHTSDLWHLGAKWSLGVIKMPCFNQSPSPISLTNSQFGKSLTFQISLKSLICLIMWVERENIAVGENLIKLCVLALLLPSIRLMPNTLPCHPISAHWMQVQHSRHCQIILQQSPKGKSMHQLP